MAEAYRYLVMQEMLRAMKEDIDLVPMPGDECKAILPDNIVFRKVAVIVMPQDQHFTMEPVFPGIILSTPYDEPFNPNSGESAHDEAVYRWLIQIVDSDNREPELYIRTFWKWQEQIWRLFNFNTLCNVNAFKVLSLSRTVDVVDEKKWLKDENFICGVEVHVQVWMTRGAS